MEYIGGPNDLIGGLGGAIELLLPHGERARRAGIGRELVDCKGAIRICGIVTEQMRYVNQ